MYSSFIIRVRRVRTLCSSTETVRRIVNRHARTSTRSRRKIAHRTHTRARMRACVLRCDGLCVLLLSASPNTLARVYIFARVPATRQTTTIGSSSRNRARFCSECAVCGVREGKSRYVCVWVCAQARDRVVTSRSRACTRARCLPTGCCLCACRHRLECWGSVVGVASSGQHAKCPPRHLSTAPSTRANCETVKICTCRQAEAGKRYDRSAAAIAEEAEDEPRTQTHKELDGGGGTLTLVFISRVHFHECLCVLCVACCVTRCV